MSSAHFHLMVNHFPIMGLIFGLIILIAGFALKNHTVKKTALALFVFSALTAMAANISGENAEEILEEMEGISHRLIHEHEEKAESFFALMVGLGILSALTLVADAMKKSWSKWLYIALLVIGIIASFFAQQTGTSGGEISHPELRQGEEILHSNHGGSVE